MSRYETVIHIINEGDDSFDAGERAGEILDSLRITGDMTLYCEPTRIYRDEEGHAVHSSAEQYLVAA